MGMGLQYAVNLFSTLPKNYCGMVALGSDIVDNCVDSNNPFPKKEANIGLRQPQDCMDGMLKECSRDSIRNMMLKQEKIFKEQVSELHRLYQVQKILTAELSKELRLHSLTSAASGAISDSKSGLRSSGSTSLTSHSPSYIDRSNSIAQPDSDHNFHQIDISAGPSTRVCVSSRETFKVRTGLDLGLPVNKDYMTSVNTDQNKSPIVGSQAHGRIGLERAHLFTDEDSDLDLTLSIGNGTNRKKFRQGDKEKGPCELAFAEARKPILAGLTRQQQGKHSETTPQFDNEGVQRPPWLLQALSLSRT